jgi:hypothetical protein
MNAYLGLVPRIKESGNSTKVGHINRASRKLTRSLLTQSLIQAIDASLYFRKFYENIKARRGAGRSRIALIRKLCGVMRRMLLNNEKFRDIKQSLYDKKINCYEKQLKEFKMERKRA